LDTPSLIFREDADADMPPPPLPPAEECILMMR
jgi:hypothetical protein